MAKLRIFQSIDKNDYNILFTNDTWDISTSDKDLIEKFGEPEVNFGGDFDNGAGITFTIPDEFVKVVSGLPYKRIVDITIAPWDTDTAAKLELYRTTMTTRVTSAFTTLRSKADTFTNEYVTTI